MPSRQARTGATDWIRQLALALDLPVMLIGALLGGGLVGYFLDEWLHTEPWLMLFFGLLGFIGGLRAVLQSLAHRGGSQGRRGDES